ncbi:MAG: SDR family NAD(P)-dependent oxidoreductase, partial [Prochlorothrix sp.]
MDHTHADAVVTLTNTPQGAALVKEIYGDRILFIPYVMPGFILARKIWELTQGIDWSQYEGMILLNHGIFSFADDAKTAYETMIQLVTEAEDALQARQAVQFALGETTTTEADLLTLAQVRRQVSQLKGAPMLAQLDQRPEAVGFAQLPNVATIATRGPITPDHVIRTKLIPVVVDPDNPSGCVESYGQAYGDYFQRNTDGKLTMLDPAPRWGVWPGQGTIAFDRSAKASQIITDIIEHTRQAIQMGEKLGGWTALSERDLFEMEYWELEQAKLGKGGSASEFQGKAVLVTGAASGIGKACAEYFHSQGAAVVGLDLNPETPEILNKQGLVGLVGSVTEADAVREAVATTVRLFGGLDILVSNAGIFPPGQTLETLDSEIWEKSLRINLLSQQSLLKA